MNSRPGVNEMLALLDTLKGVAAEFVDREEKLEKDFRARSAAAQNALSNGNQTQESAAAASELNAADTLEMDKQGLQSRFETRQARINRVHAAISGRLLGAISDSDAGWRNRTQQGVQAAELRRDEELANATTAHETFQQNLAAAGNLQTRLETKARRAFRGYWRFRRLLAPERKWPDPNLAPDENVLFNELQKIQAKISGDLGRFGNFTLPKFFKFVPFWLLAIVLLGVVAADPVLVHFGRNVISHLEAGIALTVLLAVVIIYFLGGRSAAPLAGVIAGDLAKMRRFSDACADKSAAHFQHEQERIKNEFETSRQTFNQEWRQAVRDIGQVRGEQPTAMSAKASRLLQKNEQWRQRELRRLQERHDEARIHLKEKDAAQVRQLTEAYKTLTAQIESDHQARWRELEADWKSRCQALCESGHAANAAAAEHFPAWDAALWQNWTPPTDFQNAAKFGRLEVEVEKFAGPLPRDARLRWPGAPVLSLPLSLVCPQQGFDSYLKPARPAATRRWARSTTSFSACWPRRRRAS